MNPFSQVICHLQPVKIKATKIWLHRAEGPSDLCVEKTFQGDDCWKQADVQLDTWAQTAPKSGGYDKTDFKVKFADGEDYCGRFDLQHPDVPNRESSLADHIAHFILFCAGHYRPPGMSEEKYEKLMKTDRFKHDIDDFIEFWNTYEIPSPYTARRTKRYLDKH